MKRTDCFVTPVWVIDNLQIDNSKLIEHAQQLRIKNPEKRNPESYQEVNVLKWKSFDLSAVEILAVPELAKLVKLVKGYADECFAEMNPRDNAKLDFKDICVWYNIYDVGADLESHVHPGNCISATYYIKSQDNCGDFAIGTADRSTTYQYNPKFFKERNEFTSVKQFFKPKVNSLIMIPSNIMHWVTPNRSNEERISISFNLKVTGDNKFPPNHRLFKQ
jgi:uncharacterized protein (TIGR02466 family)